MNESVRMTSTTPAGGSAPGSPTSKIKFLCSQGGKILLRPGDSVLKYVGGETRVVSIPRNIDFSGLSKKIAALTDGGDVILKYQLINEDLDTLVTVRTDQDLRHMLDEYDRHEISGAPKLRAFLFPSCPPMTQAPANLIDPHSLHQLYIDAINGVFRIGPKYSSSILGAAAAASSTTGSSSPKSLDSVENVAPGPDAVRLHNYIASRLFMHKVQSSPNLLLNNHNHPYHLGHHHHRSGHQSPQQNVSGYQSPVVYHQFDKQMQPLRRAAAVVEQRKAGYPPPQIMHVRSVSAIFPNEDYVVERRLDMEDWLSRMR